MSSCFWETKVCFHGPALRICVLRGSNRRAKQDLLAHRSVVTPLSPGLLSQAELKKFLRSVSNFLAMLIDCHPDKRPDSRLRFESYEPHYVIGSRRRNRRAPRSTGDAA